VDEASRAALVSAAILPLREHASPGRIPAPRPRNRDHVVQIRFTDFAPTGPNFRFRLHTLYGPTPEEAAGVLLGQLDLAARDLQVRGMKLNDVAVLRRMPDDAEPHLHPGTLQPVAFVDGLSESQLASALAAHAAAGRWM